MNAVLEKITNERIEYTGGYYEECENEESLYTHLELTLEEYNLLKEDMIEELAKTLDIDFISVLKTGEVDFIHYSSEDNEESINNKGLMILESDFIMDLGTGIYAIEESNSNGHDSLYDYFCGCEKDGSDTILKVTGTYTGDYLECIYGEGHLGYIVLLNNIPADKIGSEIVTFEEEFGFYSFDED